LATQQAKPTITTLKGLTQLLNHAVTHPDAEMRFHTSDVVPCIDSDASCLSESKARSRAAGHHHLSSHPDKLQGKPPPFNGSVNTLCSTMREIVSSAAEAELGAFFHSGKEACSTRTALEEMGHPQPPTPIGADNNAAAGTANNSIKQKRSKATDLRFCCMQQNSRRSFVCDSSLTGVGVPQLHVSASGRLACNAKAALHVVRQFGPMT
jgi:hypothetical protein